jgi:hypothetical protein
MSDDLGDRRDDERVGDAREHREHGDHQHGRAELAEERTHVG